MSSTQGEGHKHFWGIMQENIQMGGIASCTWIYYNSAIFTQNDKCEGTTRLNIYSLRLFISNLGFTSLFKKKKTKYLSMFVITQELGVL